MEAQGYPCEERNDFQAPDHLYRNNHDGTFSDVIRETVPHTSWFSMGADAGDINNDGRLDLLSADMSSTTHFMQKTTMGAMGRKKRFLETASPRQYMRNALYLNTGTPRFMEVAYLTGLADTDWTWSVKLADFDNDGRVDVFFTNGTARNTTDSDKKIDIRKMAGRTMWEAWKNDPPRREHNLVFRNLGQLRFENVSAAWGLDHLGMSYAAAYSDLDRDGDLDLVVVNLDEPVHLYRNQATDGNSLLIRLRSTEGNRFGIGATVRIRCGDDYFLRQLKTCSGFMSSDEPLLHF
ncbi:MAG: CRTAC1 family protein, partial [Pseudomonadales bacterium]